jgi:hypothetical protein
MSDLRMMTCGVMRCDKCVRTIEGISFKGRITRFSGGHMIVAGRDGGWYTLERYRHGDCEWCYGCCRVSDFVAFRVIDVVRVLMEEGA